LGNVPALVVGRRTDVLAWTPMGHALLAGHISRDVIRRYYERLPAGSYLGFSHVTGDHYPEGVQGLVKLYESSSNPVTLRTRDEVAEMIDDFEIVEPGVVYVPNWRPDTPEDAWENPERSIVYGAVGRKA
ncbi:SAM-dependent methyltransferase, partial [Saccharopolyspora sp. NPDC002686]|uniref:SAM-dependent methyltransferase n=1 Tax=Saccharopolyspora sp. NPDC002686 TaxID=3154541 RepID=UPI003333EFDB